MTALKLAAFDAEDLAVLSAHVQDAVLTSSDLAFLAREQRFALVLQRFGWEQVVAPAGQDSCPQLERRLSGLHFERVLAVRSKAVSRNGAQALELLAINFTAGDAPAGTISLIFAGNAEIQLDVECIEAALSDLGVSWPTGQMPQHDNEEKA